MAEKQVRVPVLAKLTKFCKKTALSPIKKAKRNKNRRLRRKRSRLRFLKHLKQVRVDRYSSELCERVEVFDVTDMECAPTFEPAVTDVAEWQNAHQMAYWKSRAISLEFENRMLHEHIRKLHLRQIEEHNHQQKETTDEPDENEEDGNEDERCDEDALPPREQVGKAEQEVMKKLYGEMAPKICGMETAVQLNYDFQIDKYNPPHWPNLPLNL